MRPKRSVDAYQWLREEIVSLRLAPGARIVETRISSFLEISRTPVRTALQRLQQEGYLVPVSKGRQTRLRVAPVSPSDAEDLFGIVGEVEGLGARWAAGLPTAERIELVKEMRAINDQLLEAARASPPDQNHVFDLHTRFHAQYMIALRRPRLRNIHQGIKPQAERYRRIYSAIAGHSEISAEEHQIILRRIEEGDAEGAQRAVQSNWRNAGDRLAGALARQRKAGDPLAGALAGQTSVSADGDGAR